MALIGKIRKNMWLVIVLVAAALAGFIIQDMTNGGSSGFFSNRTTVGKIEGQKVDIIDFQKTESALYSNGGDPYASKNSVWNFYLENAIINKIAKQAGIGVGADELQELEFGANLSPITRQFYSGQNGQLDRDYINNVKKAIDENTVNPEFAAKFNELRKQVIKQAKQTKLDNIVSKALYTPTWYAEAMDKINNEQATFEYVSVPFTAIPDTDVKLTDEDYAKYIKKYPSRYTNKEEVRNVSFVSYDIKPTVADSTKILAEITDVATKFAAATNDSLFAASNNGFYNSAFAKKDDLVGKLKENIGGLAIGQIYGPYQESGSYVVAKLISKKVVADSASASHILRSVTNGDPVQMAAANKYIDSVRVLIENGTKSFADVATVSSQDPGSQSKGGDLGTFGQGAMVGPFNDAVFNGKTGGLYKVTTQFGIHLIKVGKLVYKSNDPKYQVAYVTKPIVASDETQDAQLQKVMAVLEKTKKLDELTKMATGDVKVEVAGGLKKNDFVVSTLGGGETSREIIKWAFDSRTKIGDVSPLAHTYKDEAKFVNSRYVIAALKSIDPAGPATIESVKTQIEAQVRNAKKAEMISAKLTGNDLVAMAAAYNTVPAIATNVNLVNPQLGTTSEATVVAKALALNPGSVSKPIEGQSGVFVAKLTSKTPAVVEKGAMSQKMMLTQMARGQVSYRLMETMKKNAKIDDKRFDIF